MTADTVNNGSHTASYADPVLPKGWAPSDDSFTSDDVLNAYFLGKDAGEKEWHQRSLQQFKTKIKTATAVVQELTDLANEHGYQFLTAFLRYLGDNSFEAIYFVNEEVYLSPEMKDALRLARAFKKKYQSEDFYISFLFSGFTGEINIDALVADGYVLKKV